MTLRIWSLPAGGAMPASLRTNIIDADSGREHPIFNPRSQNWSDHFEWIGLEIIGLTEQGRAMIEHFDDNSFKRITIREDERRAGKHPPLD